MHFLRSGLLVQLLVFLVNIAAADTVTLEADKDNTLYQSPTGSLGNGAGERLFAGVTNAGFIRRTLLHFDLGSLPAGATITSVTLDMRITHAPFLPPSTTFNLHRVTQDWGESTTDAPGEEGSGAPIEDDDVSWIHTFYPSSFWTNAGGDFVATISASQTTSGSGLGPIAWTSIGLVSDVQAWVDDPSSNFGWLIKASNESQPANAKRFNSREYIGDTSTRPRLTIEYTPAVVTFCSPAAANSTGSAGVISATGSVLANDNDWNLSAASLPPGELAFFLCSTTQGVYAPPSSRGTICVLGNIGRFNAQAANSGASGTIALAVDLTDLPTNPHRAALAGQTWGFQCWYRDGAANNFTDALAVTFQ